ncbi:class I SAM-dependent methyltransferase [Lysinibacillus piscis]|uniref:Methyltransferase domain-containing protein n=1 Tax=Lysinibacillus piscis TaxID=2518931 RepID=A0ABQ5NJK8_9BACI|nr:class I SAM-dependent methyltransferase [Lysinibacillus sp. KH24]GLC88543.1 hypothetical protein LYSBPC_16700 [Lysinibacillus sp. KH24]
MKLLDPTTFENWIPPHSIKWYKQLSHLQKNYEYPWRSVLSEPNGESMFDQIVMQTIPNKKVLDVGCGHGEFTLKCSLVAKEIVGFDATDNFVQVGNDNKKSNASFIVGNIKDGLPFKAEEFNCAYIRKGPTSAYLALKQVIKKGGAIIGLHPGDALGKELPLLFPHLFEISEGTPILDSIEQKLKLSNFSQSHIKTVDSTEYIQSPLDILKLRCFGQHPSIFETLKEKNLTPITTIFEQNATEKGLPIHFSRYIVQIIV